MLLAQHRTRGFQAVVYLIVSSSTNVRAVEFAIEMALLMSQLASPVLNEEACQSLLLKMRDEGLVKFDIHKGRWMLARG
jgi:hypothetical protein